MSGPTYSLHAASAYVLRRLMEHPEHRTAQEIADGSAGHIDSAAARDGLHDLERRGLAGQDADGRWHLTPAGRAQASA